MSYDLYFYKHKDNNLTEKECAGYLTANLPFTNTEHPKQWHYENPETGVYFIIDWNESNTEAEEIMLFDSFPEFVNLNFNLSVNFFRPDYFGVEIFPVIEKLIADLDLYVLNPQDEVNADNPAKFSSGYFLEQWIRHNKRVSAEKFEELGFNYMPAEKSDYIWNYLFHKAELEGNIKEDIFVPGYFILKCKGTGQLYTACVWPNHIPLILPPVDFVVIQKMYRKLFKEVEESGIVKRESMDHIVRTYFDDFEFKVPGLKILTQANADKLAKEFNNLKIERKISEFESVDKDRFVNVNQ